MSGWNISDILVVCYEVLVSFGWLVEVEGGRWVLDMLEKLMLVCLNIVLLCRMWVWLLLFLVCC